MAAKSKALASGVGIYTRISSDPDGTALGVARQRDDCEALCARKGWTVAGYYQDNDLSAYSRKVVRPSYQQMLKDIEAGVIGGIVVYDTDRLTRQPKEMEHIIELADRHPGLRLATCSGDIDLATDNGQMMARIVGATARKASQDTARRVKRKKLELAVAGKWAGGGRRPFGYEKDGLTVRPAEAEVVREMAGRVVAGESLGSIARDMDRRGVKTVGGKSWRLTTLRQLLTGGRIAGRRTADGEDVGPAAWAEIISLKLSRQLRATLLVRSPRQRAPRSYMLARLVYCGRCGKPMQASPHNGRRRYACVRGVGAEDHCGGTFIMAEAFEDHVRNKVVNRLLLETDWGERSGPANPDAAKIEEQLEADQAKVEELVKAYAAGDISKAAWEGGRTILAERIEAANRAVRAPHAAAFRDLVPGDLKRGAAIEWDKLDVSRQAAICRLVIKRVVVGPGTTPGRREFDFRRVTVEELPRDSAVR